MERFYTRIFSQILESSLARDWQARHVFEDMLKLTTDGIVDMTRDAIARRTNIPQEVVDRAIQILEAPDPESRDQAEEGRRILRLDDHRDWGWLIVNWEKYDKIRSLEERKERNTARMRKIRETGSNSHPSPTPLSQNEETEDRDREGCAQNRTAAHKCAQPRTSKSFQKPSLEEMLSYGEQIKLLSQEVEACRDHYESNGWKVGKASMKCWKGSMRTWKRNYENGTYRSTNNVSPHQASQTELIIRQKELDACEKTITSILNSYEAHQSMTSEDAEKIKPLRARRKELKAILGIQV